MSATPATLLIVDDDVNVRQVLEASLQSQGYLTLTARSGEEALVTVAQQTPDLILLDIMMPGLSGYEVARQLKGNSSTAPIPIIMLSGLGDPGARILGLEAGAEDFLNKPVGSDELWLRVRNLLRLKPLVIIRAITPCCWATSASIRKGHVWLWSPSSSGCKWPTTTR